MTRLFHHEGHEGRNEEHEEAGGERRNSGVSCLGFVFFVVDGRSQGEPFRYLRYACGAVLLALFMLACRSSAEPRNLVFISLDTVRRDHLPTYGYARDTAPAVDALARRGVVFWNAFAQHTQTDPSHTSMFTGVYPHVHGNQMNGHRLAPQWVTLAQVLQRAGFDTGAFVSGLPMDGDVTGLDRGFDVYDDEIAKDSHRDGRLTVARAVEWLKRRTPDRRFFLFVHLYDAHAPYLPAGRYAHLYRSTEPGPRLTHVQPGHVVSDRNGVQQLHLNGYVDRYDATIRYADDALAALLPHLDLESTAVVVIADHGETLGERWHMLDHGAAVFDEQIRIPLIVVAFGFAPRRVESSVETVDLLPTLLELLGVPIGDLPVQGRNLVPSMLGRHASGERFVFSSARCDPTRLEDRGYELAKDLQIVTIRSPQWKLITYPGVEREYVELYDIEADPGERRNVADDTPLLVKSLLARLHEWNESPRATVPTPDVPPDVRERLRQLGYID